MPFGKGIRTQQHHGASLGDGKRLAHTHSVGSHQIDLKFTNLIARNANVAQLAHAGGDRIRHAIFRDQRIHHRAGLIHRFAGVGSQQHRPALDRDFANFFERQIVAVNVQSVHIKKAGRARLQSCQQIVSHARLFSRCLSKRLQNVRRQRRDLHLRVHDHVHGFALRQ